MEILILAACGGLGFLVGKGHGDTAPRNSQQHNYEALQDELYGTQLKLDKTRKEAAKAMTEATQALKTKNTEIDTLEAKIYHLEQQADHFTSNQNI